VLKRRSWPGAASRKLPPTTCMWCRRARLVRSSEVAPGIASATSRCFPRRPRYVKSSGSTASSAPRAAASPSKRCAADRFCALSSPLFIWTTATFIRCSFSPGSHVVLIPTPGDDLFFGIHPPARVVITHGREGNRDEEAAVHRARGDGCRRAFCVVGGLRRLRNR